MATRGTLIVALHVSSVHAFEGRPSDGPRPDPSPVSRDHVVVRAGLGLEGDRFFNHPAHKEAAVTLFAAESLSGFDVDPLLARRNIVLRGRGGKRCVPLGDGVLRSGPVEVTD